MADELLTDTAFLAHSLRSNWFCVLDLFLEVIGVLEEASGNLYFIVKSNNILNINILGVKSMDYGLSILILEVDNKKDKIILIDIVLLF